MLRWGICAGLLTGCFSEAPTNDAGMVLVQSTTAAETDVDPDAGSSGGTSESGVHPSSDSSSSSSSGADPSFGDESADSGTTDSPNGGCTLEDDSACAVGCNPDRFKGRNYAFCQNDLTWEGAREACQSMGMDLLVIGDQAEDEWATERSTAIGAWFGGHDQGAEGTWVWLDEATPFYEDGAPVGPAYTHWADAEPNNFGGDEDCTSLTDWGWVDGVCYFAKQYFCEHVDES